MQRLYKIMLKSFFFQLFKIKVIKVNNILDNIHKKMSCQSQNEYTVGKLFLIQQTILP